MLVVICDQDADLELDRDLDLVGNSQMFLADMTHLPRTEISMETFQPKAGPDSPPPTGIGKIQPNPPGTAPDNSK